MGYSVDVVIPTKNRLKPCLSECLNSMYSEVPLNRLIVIDAYSDDGTVEFIRNFCKEKEIDLILKQTDAPLPKARQIGIELVETDWFLFLDSDVELTEGYFNQLTNHIEKEVGAVQGRKQQTFDENAEEYCPDDKEWVERRSFRGGTHATLIRKSAVEGINIPEDLRTWEDEYLRRYIEGKKFVNGNWVERKENYEWIFAPDAIFYPDQSSSFEKTEYEGRIFAKYGFKPAYRVIGRAIKSMDEEDIRAAKEYVKTKLGVRN